MIDSTQPEIPTPCAVARLIAGGEPPDWLVFQFEVWAPAIALQRHMVGMTLTRSEARERLTNMARAAKMLRFGLAYPPARRLLEEPQFGAVPNLGELLQTLGDLERRANAGKASPSVATEDGTAPKGRGRAKPPGTIEAKAMIAGMIAVAWKEVRGRYPGPRNRAACEAANCLWRLSTETLPKRFDDEVERGEDRLSGWRRPFEAALAKDPVLGVNHAEFVRHMREGQGFEAATQRDRELCERLAREESKRGDLQNVS